MTDARKSPPDAVAQLRTEAGRAWLTEATDYMEPRFLPLLTNRILAIEEEAARLSRVDVVSVRRDNDETVEFVALERVLTFLKEHGWTRKGLDAAREVLRQQASETP